MRLSRAQPIEFHYMSYLYLILCADGHTHFNVYKHDKHVCIEISIYISLLHSVCTEISIPPCRLSLSPCRICLKKAITNAH